MKVLYLSPGAELGGAEQSLLGLVSSLDRARFHPVVVLPRSGPLAEELDRVGSEVRVVPIPRAVLSYGRWSSPFSSAAALPAALAGALPVVARLARLISAEGVALVHSNGLKAHLLGCPLRWITRTPLVWHLRDILPPGPLRQLMRFLGRRAPAAIIANSRAVARCLGEGSGTPPRLRVIPNGIDLKRYAPVPGLTPLRTEYGLRSDQIAVGIVGVLAPWKGFDVFLESVAAVAPARRDVVFFVVGDEIYDTRGHSGYRRRLEARARALGLGGRMIFTGFRRDIPEVMNSLDVLVHASVGPEPFGRVLMEAMACGRAVIATSGGGVPEVLGPDGATGVIIPPSDAQAMEAAMLALVGDPARRVRMGCAGRQRAEAIFAVEDHARAVEAVYAEVMRGR